MAARKKSRSSKARRTRTTEIRRTPTRDPGPTGNVGCYFLAAAMLAIAVIIVLLEVVG